MVALKIYSKCNKTKYKSTLCSKATFFIIITKAASILLPFIFAYKSKGFWLKRDTFYEQPNIKFKHEYIFTAEAYDQNIPIFCSNIIHFPETKKFDKCSLIKVREKDNNDDGKYDELHFGITLSSAEQTRIHSMTLILLMNYEIYTVCPFQMQSAAIIQQHNYKPSTGLKLVGDLVLTQSWPLPCRSRKTYDDHTYTLDTNGDFKLWDFINDHFARNVSTKVDNLHTMWTSEGSSAFSLDVHLRYPEQAIYYKPNFWHVVKYAWIQYLSLFVVVSWLINKIQDYVFTNRLVLYRIDTKKL